MCERIASLTPTPVTDALSPIGPGGLSEASPMVVAGVAIVFRGRTGDRSH
jgi:hypothetical protein